MKPKTMDISALLNAGQLGSSVRPALADLTPMLDTIFLIILLLLATLINSSIVRGFPVALPTVSDEATNQKEQEAIEISVDQEGQIYIAKEQIAFDQLASAVQPATAGNPTAKVLVRADRSVAYGRVATVLSCVSACAPDRQVILLVERTDAEPKPEINRKEGSTP